MKLKLPLESHEISKLCFLSAFFFKFLNGYSYYYDGAMIQDLNGLPLIYIHNSGAVSLEYTLYFIPFILNILSYSTISFIIIKSISFIFDFFGIEQYENDKFFYFFAGLFLISSLFYLLLITHEVILCCGPRGELEIADRFIFWR